jgi:N-methylhydantoinase A
VPVLRRDGIQIGTKVTGPAIIEQYDSTLVLYPGQAAHLEPSGNLIVTT